MKIAQVVCVFPPYKGGIGNVAREYSSVLAGYGHEVTVFTPDYKVDSYNDKLSYKVVRMKPLIKYGNGAFLPQLIFELRNFDIVHLHYPFFGGAESVWLSKLIFPFKFKLVIHYHMDVEGLSFVARFLSLPSKILIKSLFKKAEAVTCASFDYLENSSIKKIFHKYKNKFYEIPFGVDSDKFKPELHKKAKGFSYGPERKFLDQKKDDSFLKVLFVGGLDKAHYFKGVDVLLKAFSGLNLSSKLIIVGSGDLEDYYKKLAKDLKIENRVEFKGKVNDVELTKNYQEADLFVLPSINKCEAFGLVLLEAMSCGVPVLASNLPGVRSVFQKGVQGLLINPNDENDLRIKMEKILLNNDQRKKMSTEARKLIENKYSWKKIGEELDKIYKNL